MSTVKSKIKLIGRREFVSFPQLNMFQIEAKIDTGAYTNAIHCSKIEQQIINNASVLVVKFENDATHTFNDYTIKKIKNSFGEAEERYIIKTIIHIGRKKINSTLSLTNRGTMKYTVLIGRHLLKGKFIVDVSKLHTNGITIQKEL